MNKSFLFLSLFLAFVLFSCSIHTKKNPKTEIINTIIYPFEKKEATESNIEIVNSQELTPKLFESIADTSFVNLKDYSSDFFYDMKYATNDNFLKIKVYDCSECYLRLRTIKALLKANERFMNKGYHIKLFDCYRPLDVQKKMWSIISNPDYVANPKKGSIHNRGGAVDITLVDSNGKELDMGTPFDFFGIESSHEFENLSEEVKNNRKLLKNGMIRANFRIFDSEWWHYNLKNAKKDNLSNFKWICD
ncbi:M15 family metallopeptidase [Flavobacterium luteum]|uniref:D-alanyl-D-alanine dipeptidase n=1 Tax=Flavobacterium luteum TaxID=2026654 RepID=A0A7J5AL16_9FLAO|nr:M15 family metallopeptidase [Flavobacterium luteum]KAB1158180.1 M15 family metallopeptidase [Flavobacterium luteum]